MPRVIEAFVDLLFHDSPTSTIQNKFSANLDDQKQFTLEGFSDSEIVSVFHDDTTDACRILILYYVLAYQDSFVNKSKKIGI